MDEEDKDKRFFDPVRGDQFDPEDEVPWATEGAKPILAFKIEKPYEPEPWL